MKQYIAMFTDSRQISVEDFEVYTPTMRINDNTTILEIKEWHEKFGRDKMDNLKIVEISKVSRQIIE